MNLYKYLNPERVDVIENLKIRFTQPLYLNDPYETNPVVTGSGLTNEQWEIIGRIECERNGLNYEDYKHLNDPNLRKSNFYKALEVLMMHFHYRTGVLSLSETHNNALMWAHYCLNHQGYAIQFDSNHAFFRSSAKEYTINGINKVIYTQNRPNVTLEKLSMRDLYFTKSDEWSYEKEWRILKNINDANVRIDNGMISLFDLPPELITGVYLGAACSDELENKILKAIKKNKLECSINKIILNPSNYSLNTINIDEWNELKGISSKQTATNLLTNDLLKYSTSNSD